MKFQLNIPKVSIMFYVPWIYIHMVTNKSHLLKQALTEELEILGLCMIHSSKKVSNHWLLFIKMVVSKSMHSICPFSDYFMHYRRM